MTTDTKDTAPTADAPQVPSANAEATGKVPEIVTWLLAVLLVGQLGWLLYSFGFTSRSSSKVPEPQTFSQSPGISTEADPGFPQPTGGPGFLPPSGAPGMGKKRGGHGKLAGRPPSPFPAGEGPPGQRRMPRQPNPPMPGGPLPGGPGGFGPMDPFRNNLAFMVMSLSALDGTSNALTAEQKSKLAPIFKALNENATKTSSDLRIILSAVTPDQLERIDGPMRNRNARVDLPSGAPGIQGSDPLTDKLIEVLEKKAASVTASPAALVAEDPSRALRGGPSIERPQIFMGLLTLEGTSYAVTPDQAASLLATVKEIRTLRSQERTLIQSVGRVLTAQQTAAIRKIPNMTSEEMATRSLSRLLTGK